ncbi:MAG TPA: PEGA domain-containing protein [Candidatus Saccharimonadales bacterium]|nr:PEGA domain-containing protein [Candidatus Saccharimonadales bacterium]
MDFIDPDQHRKHVIMVFVGYFLVGLAVLIATLILLYVVRGYVYKKGEVVQNGLIFVSSQPHPADIYLDGQLDKHQTNSRFNLQEGSYDMELRRDGYRTWQRKIQIIGGKVVHFDYPFLFPVQLTSSDIKTYAAAPQSASSSLDRRWLLVAPDPVPTDVKSAALSTVEFELFDLKDPKRVQPSTLALPKTVITPSTAKQSWQYVEWADDNKHVVLKHIYGKDYEYILLDRTAPAAAVNLTKTFGMNPTELQLINRKYDQYYLYDAKTQTIFKASLKNPQPVDYLDHVLAYKSYGNDMMLYAAAAGPDSDGTVKIKLQQGDNSFTITAFPAGTHYVVQLAKYDGDMYMVVGAASQDKVYVYKNPLAQIADQNLKHAVPVHTLRLPSPDYVSFSDNARFIMAEHGTHFGVYDAEDDQTFSYNVPTYPLDKPQLHATWMDGNRLTYVSHGSVVVFDYDDNNEQVLVPSRPAYLPMFDPSYRTLYTLMPMKDDPTKTVLAATSLLTPADQ